MKKKIVEHSMKSLVRITVVLSTIALLSGCAGLLIDAMTRSSATGKTYGEMTKTLPPLTDGNGRLYIYRAETSTKTSLQYGYGIAKNPTLFTVDDNAYDLIWEAFKYIDLPVGQYEVTCGSDVLEKVDFWSGKRQFKRGANKIQVSISNASETFVRLDGTKEKPFFQPIIVETEQGSKEMWKLPYQKVGFSLPQGKISQQ